MWPATHTMCIAIADRLAAGEPEASPETKAKKGLISALFPVFDRPPVLGPVRGQPAPGTECGPAPVSRAVGGSMSRPGSARSAPAPGSHAAPSCPRAR
jgi:hypothetical protein